MNQKALGVRTEQWRRIVRECINVILEGGEL